MFLFKYFHLKSDDKAFSMRFCEAVPQERYHLSIFVVFREAIFHIVAMWYSYRTNYLSLHTSNDESDCGGWWWACSCWGMTAFLAASTGRISLTSSRWGLNAARGRSWSASATITTPHVVPTYSCAPSSVTTRHRAVTWHRPAVNRNFILLVIKDGKF